MKENVSGCFFSEHSVVRFLYLKTDLIEGPNTCSATQTFFDYETHNHALTAYSKNGSSQKIAHGFKNSKLGCWAIRVDVVAPKAEGVLHSFWGKNTKISFRRKMHRNTLNSMVKSENDGDMAFNIVNVSVTYERGTRI